MAVVGVGVAPVGVGFGGATPPKERDSGVPSGRSSGTPGDRHWGGMQAGHPGIPRRPGSAARADGGWHPFRPQRYRRAVGPGRIEPQAVLPPIFLDAPVLVEVSAVAGERIGVKNPSRAGLRGGGRRPNPDTIRTGSVTAPRFRSRGTSFAVRIALPYPIGTTHLGGVCSSGKAFGFASTGPENLRPSTRHRDLHRPIHTDINKTAKHIRGARPKIKQHNTITKHQNNTTTQLHNNKTAQPEIRRS